MRVARKKSLLAGLLMTSAISFSQDPNCVYLASDIYPGSFGSLPAAFTEYEGVLYFCSTGNSLGVELWKYENGMTTMVADINPGIGGSMPNQFTQFGSDLYFRATTAATGMELFRFDGTTVTVAADIVPGPSSSFVSNLVVIGSEIFFFAHDGVHGMEPWKFDGTTASLVADINPGTMGSSPWEIKGGGGYAFISATHPDYGMELWKYDGVTTTVMDIYPGTTGSDIGEMTTVGGKLCFRATDGVNGYELFVHDGTTLTNLNVNPTGDFTPWEFTLLGSNLFVRGFHPASGYELWKYDGTSASLAADIAPGSGNGHPNNMIAVGTTDLYFAGNNGTVGNELWHYDGVSASLVADIRTGPASSMPVPAFEKFGYVGNDVFVIASDGTTGDEIWRYDGTTHVLGRDIIPGGGSAAPSGLKGHDNALFFMADDGLTGGELWTWDTEADLTETINVVVCGDYTSPAGDYYNLEGSYNFVDTIPSVKCIGCDSLVTVNLTISQPTSSITVFACNDYTSPGGTYYNVEGNYTIVDVIPSLACPGVDSTITIDLTVVDDISTAVVVFTGVIVAQQSGATYQWLDCDAGYAAIPGATDQDYLPSADGNYACEITLGLCIDTTTCNFVLENTGGGGIGFAENTMDDVSIYPNPVSDLLTIQTTGSSSIQVQVSDNLGNNVLTQTIDSAQAQVDMSSLSNGIYFVYIKTDNGWFIHKLAKQ